MIGIIIALNSESKALLSNVENLKSEKFLDKTCYTGLIDGKDVVIAISGIGKVNASLTTQHLIDKYSPSFILNFGTCGGMNNTVEILKYYAIEKCCQFDFDLRDLDGVPLGYIQDYDTAYFPANVSGLDFLPKTNLGTADRFICKVEDINAINDTGCSLGDMEGGAIAQVCLSNNTPLFMIKGVSDVYGNGTAKEQFFKNLQTVGQGFPAVIRTAINSICKNLGIWHTIFGKITMKRNKQWVITNIKAQYQLATALAQLYTH